MLAAAVGRQPELGGVGAPFVRFPGFAVEIDSTPHLERDEGPQLQIEISPILVETQELFNVRGPKYAPLPACVGKQKVSREVFQLPPEPPAERNCEATLRPVDDFIGK